MCSVPSRWRRSRRTARVASWRARASIIRACSALEWSRTSGGWAMCAISSDTSASTSPTSADQPRHPAGLGDRHVEADVRAAVVVEVRRGGHAVHALAHEREVVLGWRDRRPAWPCRPRWRRAGRAPRASPRGPGRRGLPSASGGSWTTKVPAAAAAHRRQVPGLHERGDGLAQGRARDPELLGQLALGRQPDPRPEDAQTDRRAEALDGLLERVGGWTGSKTAATAASPGMAEPYTCATRRTEMVSSPAW